LQKSIIPAGEIAELEKLYDTQRQSGDARPNDSTAVLKAMYRE
jgi:hypothetical protein